MHRDLNAAKNILKRATGGRREARPFRPETPVESGPLPERVGSADESGNSICEDKSLGLFATKVAREETNVLSPAQQNSLEANQSFSD